MADAAKPRSFFLNEQHELTRGEKPSGGSFPKYAPIDWADKGRRLEQSVIAVRERIASLPDPLKDHHYFLLARPEPTLRKLSKNLKVAPTGVLEETTSYAGKDSRVFSRLGVDLLSVTRDGSAVVHTTPERAEQIASTAAALANFGVKEQSRWATLNEFGLIPIEFRIDSEWLDSLRDQQPTQSVIELQPLLTRAEVETLMRAIANLIRSANVRGQSLRGSGTDFSGRHWLRGDLARDALVRIATNFMSVQSVHSPLISEVAGGVPSPVVARSSPSAAVPVPDLPVVAVVDTGIPTNHRVLSGFRRGTYLSPLNAGGVGSHGSFVASRVVFGEVTEPELAPSPALTYFDVNVALGPNQIDHKELLPALEAVVRTTPDVRVFNLSFDAEPLSLLDSIKGQEYLFIVQDLDNFIFQNDVVVTISAGNSEAGIVPATAYPNHHSELAWALGPLARSFNGMTCGSYISRLSAAGLVKQLGWPSPFCRVGPGLANTPKPDFSASGGDGTVQYGFATGMGVWGMNEYGEWVDRSGTSFAAPLVARQAALTIRALEHFCESGARPYAATVKAFLALTAVDPVRTSAIQLLVEKTLGHGTATAERLNSPSPNTAVFLWQGVLEDKSDLARVQVPIPKAWLGAANDPVLRLFVAADIPVNAAAHDLWASRKILVHLRTGPESRAVRARVLARDHYPLVGREYNLTRVDLSNLDGDIWIIELAYDDLADYTPSMVFPSQQRIAFAAELLDKGQSNESPQSLVQSIPITQTMTRLSIPPTVARVPVVLRYS